MREILQCSQCKRAKKGEPLYCVDDEILCVYCGMALMTELTHANVEFVGYVGEHKEK
jgi:hypothetical protein